jgi:hypothetical protein
VAKLNYVGRFETNGLGPHSGGHAESVHHPHPDLADTITIPDAHLLFTGDYKRAGVDLILSKDGHEVVVHDYFKGEKRASLASPDGAHLTGDIVNALVGHVECAQAASAPDSAKVIGHVTKITGNATAIRNGVSIILNVDDYLKKSDVVPNGLVYGSNQSSNATLPILIQGIITFLPDETAKSGDLKIDTPVTSSGVLR